MKYLFFIQGEGRGHFSQALTLKEKLEARGHFVVSIIVGADVKKPLPVFFKDQVPAELITKIDSPRFITDKENKGIKVFRSSLFTVWQTPRYTRALRKIRQIVLSSQPDILVNFYESMAGNYYRLYREKRPMFCIGHQYFINHPSFRFPDINWMAKASFRFFNSFTAPRQARRIALSFSLEPDLAEDNIFVCPPLIRREIKEQLPSNKGFFLGYLLNAGYSEEIKDWCRRNPAQKVEAFWDDSRCPETRIGDNLTFHYLDRKKFIDRLASCSAYACTAGFDSVAEAAYLQKDILMIPTRNHFEQKCNAADAERVGLATKTDTFDLSAITEAISKTHSSEAKRSFKEWVDNFDDKIISILETGGKQ